jgi:hypothetical protein
MGEPENRRQRAIVRKALEGHMDVDTVVAAYVFQRYLAWEDNWRKPFMALKRLFAPSDHPGDRVGSLNVLVLTADRLLVFKGRPRAPLVKVRKQIADWPLAKLSLTSKGKQVVAHSHPSTGGSLRFDSRIIRATLTVDGEERPFIMDFASNDLAREVIAAVKEATDSPR